MTVRRTLTSGLALVLAMSLALPVIAGTRTTGDQLKLLGPPTGDCPVSAYPADTAFHILHGFGFNPPEKTNTAYGKWLFELMVDGELLPLSRIRITEVRDGVPDGFFLAKGFAYNFPDGLTAGLHNLTGIWTDSDEVVALVEDCDIEFFD